MLLIRRKRNLSLSQIGHLFSLPEIKKECFHNNRYPAILSVVYITTILPSYCVHLSNNISESGNPTTPPPPSALPAMHVNVPCPHLWTATIFTLPYLIT